jgi:hydroxyacylglutathione hydrolase
MEIITLISDDFEENTYILEYRGNAVVIDPGADANILKSKIQDLKLNLKYILLTHGHYDHILAAQALNAPIYAHENEKNMLEDPSVNLSARVIKPPLSFKNVNYYKNNPYKLDTFEIFHTPGHTAGSVVIKEGNDLFTGDTLFIDTVGRTDMPTGDSKKLKESLKIFNSFDKNTMCYPGHGEPFILKDAYKNNYFLR